MKIVYIVPGSGGTFYCHNCMRDNELIHTLKALGHDVHMIPMYLPVSADNHAVSDGTPVFYGAINVYLKEILPAYRHAPMWLEKVFDAQPLLKLAAKRAGSTRASGMEDLTISMLMGEEGRQASELEHLIGYLKKEVKPDVIHLSNALLLGLARQLKNEIGAKIVCSLQDENEWIDLMRTDYQAKVWGLMAERAVDVDMFVAPSNYCSEKSKMQLSIPERQIQTVYDGITLDGYQVSSLPSDPPVLGYLCRMSEYFGLGIVVDAFLRIKKDARFRNLKLHLTGGYTGDDKIYVNQLMQTIAQQGFEKDVHIFEIFNKDHRVRFLQSLTLLSVPVPAGEAFGAYQVEALAAGVPIVQPNVGAYPEFVESTGGGVIYQPNNGQTLAAAMVELLRDPERMRTLGEQGRTAVFDKYSMQDMAANIIQVYEKTICCST
jgi:glycosyltransferase involved in cell wall biosynthesis